MSMLDLLNPLLALAAGLYLAAAGGFAFSRVRTGTVLTGLGWGVSLAVLALNALQVRDLPLGNMYHVQVVLSLCFPPLLWLFAVRHRLSWIAIWFVVAAVLPLIGALFMDKQGGWKRMPALQSNWFVPHVLAYMIGYALCTVAFLLLIRSRIGRTRRAECLRAVYWILRTAFPFLTFGMLSGALWAEEAWGRYWSWDAKEVWSLITWGLYLIYFHCRKSSWRDLADATHLLAFLALLVTFFLVNLLPKLGSLLHSYA
jgi:ABC-type transport system involved in cytochrome c biogenesis permease subunit